MVCVCSLLFGICRGGFEFGDAGGKDSAEVRLRWGVKVAGPVESVECEAKLFKGVARSCPGWFVEDHRGRVSLGVPEMLGLQRIGPTQRGI